MDVRKAYYSRDFISDCFQGDIFKGTYCWKLTLVAMFNKFNTVGHAPHLPVGAWSTTKTLGELLKKLGGTGRWLAMN